jgi:hypothetical protein
VRQADFRVTAFRTEKSAMTTRTTDPGEPSFEEFACVTSAPSQGQALRAQTEPCPPPQITQRMRVHTIPDATIPEATIPDIPSAPVEMGKSKASEDPAGLPHSPQKPAYRLEGDNPKVNAFLSGLKPAEFPRPVLASDTDGQYRAHYEASLRPLPNAFPTPTHEPAIAINCTIDSPNPRAVAQAPGSPTRSERPPAPVTLAIPKPKGRTSLFLALALALVLSAGLVVTAIIFAPKGEPQPNLVAHGKVSLPPLALPSISTSAVPSSSASSFPREVPEPREEPRNPLKTTPVRPRATTDHVPPKPSSAPAPSGSDSNLIIQVNKL